MTKVPSNPNLFTQVDQKMAVRLLKNLFAAWDYDLLHLLIQYLILLLAKKVGNTWFFSYYQFEIQIFFKKKNWHKRTTTLQNETKALTMLPNQVNTHKSTKIQK